MIFGNWADVIVGERGVRELSENPYDHFAQGLSGIRAMLAMEVAVRNAAAFSVATSIT